MNIEFLATNKNIKELKVHNILGKKIDSFDINIEESVKTISTKKWHKGIYILNFIDNNNNNVYSKKITVE